MQRTNLCQLSSGHQKNSPDTLEAICFLLSYYSSREACNAHCTAVMEMIRVAHDQVHFMANIRVPSYQHCANCHNPAFVSNSLGAGCDRMEEGKAILPRKLRVPIFIAKAVVLPLHNLMRIIILPAVLCPL